MKKLFAVIVGTLVSLFLVAASDWVVGVFFPIGDVDLADADALAAHIANMPFAAQIALASGWLIAPLAGAWFALRIADWKPGGWIVAIVFLLAGLVNQFALSHPLWMQCCAVLFPLLGGWIAQRLHRKPYPGEPLLG